MAYASRGLNLILFQWKIVVVFVDNSRDNGLRIAFLCLMVFGSFVILCLILTENCFGISFSSHHKVGIRSKALSTEEEERLIILIHFCVAILTENCFGISF